MKYIYVEHEDTEHLREHMFVNASVYQMSKGPLHAFRKSLILEHVTLFYRQERAAIAAMYSSHPDQFVIAIPLLDIIINGRNLTTDQLFVIGPDEIIHHPGPEQFQMFGICFNYQQACKYLSPELLQAISSYSESIRANKVELPFISRFKSQCIDLYETLFANRELASKREIVEYEESIFALIEKLFTPLLDVTKPSSQFTGSRRNIVSRAIEHIVDNDITDIPVQEWADKCYCSMRSLEYAFKSIYKITPKQFLSIRRLHIVRSKIKSQEFASLKDLMSHIGVSNPGRFSAQYFNLFGEYPKQTWSRYKSLKQAN